MMKSNPVRRKILFLICIGIIAGAVFGATQLLVANPAWITMTRVEEADEAVAKFPHWKHQDEFKCYACHSSLFSMQKKVGMTHEDIDDGKYCGACHNGDVAFYPEDEDVDCEVCHAK